jgi:hypothetical protein
MPRALSGSSSGTNPCAAPALELDINCLTNTNSLNAISADLPAGDYVAEVSDCCCVSLIQQEEGTIAGVTGVISMQYNSAATGELTTLSNPDLGSFSDFNTALNTYLGNSFGFSHQGGSIRAWSNAQNPGGSSGTIRLTIRTKACVDTAPVVDGTVPPTIQFPEFTTCDMTLDQILFYEAGWKSKACCGVYVEIEGTKWLVVQRSIGADTSCGGGESEHSDCIVKAQEFGFYPAAAFPTIDGRHFFGKPTSGSQSMFRENELETLILEAIAAGQILDKAGDPTVITAIIFPHEA